jgi:hypothetical protein
MILCREIRKLYTVEILGKTGTLEVIEKKGMSFIGIWLVIGLLLT